MAEHILAIDQGTTGTTCLVFNAAGQITGRAYSELGQHFPEPGWVEHDANEIWHVSLGVAGQALKDANIEASDLVAIGITNQRETVVAWDRESGEPLYHAVVWQDRRTAKYCDQLKSEGHLDLVRSHTGLVLDPYFSGTKIRWLLDNVRGLREKAENGQALFGTIDSWLIYKLTGEHRTDYSNASRTLLFNIHELSWDEKLCEILTVPTNALPEPRPSASIFGQTKKDVFFGAEVPVAGVAGDQQAALFGQGCFEPGDGKNTYGTGSFVLINTGNEPPPASEGLLSTVAWGVGSEVHYALEASIFVTGAAVQWLRDGLELIEDASETEAIAASLSSNGGVYFVPALTGLGSPHWDPYARGTITGLTRGCGRMHIVRATLEAIAYQVYDAAKAVELATGVPLTELKADGGAVANRWLMQFQADILGVPVVVPEISETTALGAAYLAGISVGLWQQSELATLWRQAARYEPDMGRDERGQLLVGWDQAVALTKTSERRKLHAGARSMVELIREDRDSH